MEKWQYPHIHMYFCWRLMHFSGRLDHIDQCIKTSHFRWTLRWVNIYLWQKKEYNSTWLVIVIVAWMASLEGIRADGAKQVPYESKGRGARDRVESDGRATAGTITILLLCLSLFHIATQRGIIAQRLGQPLIHLIQQCNTPQLHSNYWLAGTAARAHPYLRVVMQF